MTKKQKQADEKRRAMEYLHEHLLPGDTVYTILRHVSRSGMSRSISVLMIDHGRIVDISPDIALVCGFRLDNCHGGAKVGGCGMDMGFHLVYSLSHALFPTGFDCIGDDCPANDHANGVATAHHADGGYALKQQWL